jgi:hypothetical protein
VSEWGHEARPGEQLSGILEKLAAHADALPYRIFCTVHATAYLFRYRDSAHHFMEKLGVPGGSQRQDAKQDWNPTCADCIGDLQHCRSGIHRLGYGKLCTPADLFLKPFRFPLQPLPFRMRFEDDSCTISGLPGDLYKVEDIHIPNRCCVVPPAVGDGISCGHKHRVDPQGPTAPEQTLKAQGVVIPGCAVEDRRFPESTLNQGTECHGAHVGLGYRIGGHAESEEQGRIYGSKRVQQGTGIRTGRRHNLDCDCEFISQGLQHGAHEAKYSPHQPVAVN